MFWRVEGFDVAHVEGLQKQLARELGTDPAATAATQTTRIPGFKNHKHTAAPVVTVEYYSINQSYLPTRFPTVAPNSPRVIPQPFSRSPSTFDPLERARGYLARVPPAIAGERGDVHTFRVCCRLVRGFALDDDEALAVLTEWNTFCRPPWSQHELRHKLRRARRYGREPVGGLVDAAAHGA